MKREKDILDYQTRSGAAASNPATGRLLPALLLAASTGTAGCSCAALPLMAATSIMGVFFNVLIPLASALALAVALAAYILARCRRFAALRHSECCRCYRPSFR